MESFFGLTLKELEDAISALGNQNYRAKQLYRWVYTQGLLDFQDMTNIPKSLRSIFGDMFSTEPLPMREARTSLDGSTKFAFTTQDGNTIESILMPEKDRITLCVSSQIGCRMGCKFCVTGKIGFVRNLTPAEIVNQVVTAKDYLKKSGPERISNLVFMGMGEPMDNLENVKKALDILKDPHGLDFSYRRITVSSVGLVEGLATLDYKTATIAISLNASDDATRSSIMPINRLYPIGKVVNFVRTFVAPNRIRITFEYVMLKGINDSLDDAKRLASLLKGIKCKINLIPYNESPYNDFKAPEGTSVNAFREYLSEKHFTTVIRDSRGQDVSGACGQLGMSYLKGL